MQSPSEGGVELREDVPLSGARGPGSCGAGGPRMIAGCFGALAAAVTVALVAQVWAGVGGPVPHGSVSSSAAECSRAGTDLLRSGGRAIDAAVAAAFCLAVLSPHRTSLDASGALLYWEYRRTRSQPAQGAEWGGPPPRANLATDDRPPRLVEALATLHARLGIKPWSEVLQPAIDLARSGYKVSAGLAAAYQSIGEVGVTGEVRTAPRLARYLIGLQRNTSSELSQLWSSSVRLTEAPVTPAGRWRIIAGGTAADNIRVALAAALQPAPIDLKYAQARVMSAVEEAESVASGLAVVDQFDTYVALVTGLSAPFGSGVAVPGGWITDNPGSNGSALIDLAPAILTDDTICGSRFILGAESGSSLAQVAVALAVGGDSDGSSLSTAVEKQRSGEPQSAVNLIKQKGDQLTSYADSRGGGLASRF